MSGLSSFRHSFIAAHLRDLASLLFVVVLSLILGLLIPDDRASLVVALIASAAGAAVVVSVWSKVQDKRSRQHSAAATVTERTERRGPARLYLVPRELPPVPSGFVGRDEEIGKLFQGISRDRDRVPFIAAIYGVPGIGKSALAVTFAHRASKFFPDGQLFVQMRAAGGQPAKTDDPIAHFVAALKGPNDSLPSSTKDLRAEYAALTQRYSVLLVLDDVAPDIDIIAICPSSSKCAIIVTCRESPNWPDVSYEGIRLEALEAPAAVNMLRATVDPDWQSKEERQNNEEQPYRELASQCGREPLALRAAGTALADRSNWDIGLITKQAKSTLTLPAGEHLRSGIFDAAYALLTTEEQRVLRILGALQESDFAPWMIAVALGITEEKGGRLASRLADAGLIERYNPGSGTPSYRAEEPVLSYAYFRAIAEDSTLDAIRWRESFSAEQSRRRTHLPDEKIGNLDDLLGYYGGFTPAIEAVRYVMTLAREQGSRKAEASACAALAELYTDLGDMVVAQDLAQQAVEIGDDRIRARSYRCLTRLERRRHRLALAIKHADDATDCAVIAHDFAEQVRILVEKSVVVALQGEPAKADKICADALRICDTLNDADGSLRVGVKWCQGRVWLHARRYEEASRVLQDAKILADELGEKRLGAWIEHTSASVALATGKWDIAEQHAIAGMDAFSELRHRYGVAHCRHRLGQIRLERHRIGDAIRFLRESLETFHSCGDIWIESEVSLDLADAYLRRGQSHDALQMQRIARRAYRQLGSPAMAGAQPGC